MRNKLTERTKILILEGANITGSMFEGYHYAWERLYADEIDGIEEFCKWIDENVGGCSEYNIDRLYDCWKNPSESNTLFVDTLREKISRFKFPQA